MKAPRIELKEEVTKHGAASSSTETTLPAELPIAEIALNGLVALPNN